MKKFLLLPVLLLLIYAPVVHAQSLDIPIKGYGFSFGNSKNFTGLRFNFLDQGTEKINGLNFAIGRPGWPWSRDVTGTYNGLNLGVIGAGAKNMNGAMISIFSFVADEMNGILISTWSYGTSSANRPRTDLDGEVTNKITGFAFCGIGCQANTLNGIIFSGLGPIGEKINGIAIGGLGVFALLSDTSDDDSAVGSEINGIAIGGLFVGTGRMNGISIGLINYAKELNGIQIGLVNIAKNNPAWAQILPGINAHFSFRDSKESYAPLHPPQMPDASRA